MNTPYHIWTPAQEGQYIAIAVKGTEFYKVVSHPLKINLQDISLYRGIGFSSQLYSRFFARDLFSSVMFSPQKTHRHCTQVWQRPFWQFCQAIVQGTPAIVIVCLNCELAVFLWSATFPPILHDIVIVIIYLMDGEGGCVNVCHLPQCHCHRHHLLHRHRHHHNHDHYSHHLLDGWRRWVCQYLPSSSHSPKPPLHTSPGDKKR